MIPKGHQKNHSKDTIIIDDTIIHANIRKFRPSLPSYIPLGEDDLNYEELKKYRIERNQMLKILYNILEIKQPGFPQTFKTPSVRLVNKLENTKKVLVSDEEVLFRDEINKSLKLHGNWTKKYAVITKGKFTLYESEQYYNSYVQGIDKTVQLLKKLMNPISTPIKVIELNAEVIINYKPDCNIIECKYNDITRYYKGNTEQATRRLFNSLNDATIGRIESDYISDINLMMSLQKYVNEAKNLKEYLSHFSGLKDHKIRIPLSWLRENIRLSYASKTVIFSDLRDGNIDINDFSIKLLPNEECTSYTILHYFISEIGKLSTNYQVNDILYQFRFIFQRISRSIIKEYLPVVIKKYFINDLFTTISMENKDIIPIQKFNILPSLDGEYHVISSLPLDFAILDKYHINIQWIHIHASLNYTYNSLESQESGFLELSFNQSDNFHMLFQK